MVYFLHEERMYMFVNVKYKDGTYIKRNLSDTDYYELGDPDKYDVDMPVYIYNSFKYVCKQCGILDRWFEMFHSDDWYKEEGAMKRYRDLHDSIPDDMWKLENEVGSFFNGISPELVQEEKFMTVDDIVDHFETGIERIVEAPIGSKESTADSWSLMWGIFDCRRYPTHRFARRKFFEHPKDQEREDTLLAWPIVRHGVCAESAAEIARKYKSRYGKDNVPLFIIDRKVEDERFVKWFDKEIAQLVEEYGYGFGPDFYVSEE